MNNSLALNPSNARLAEMTCQDGVLTVRRARGALETLVFMTPASALLLVVITAGIVALGLLLRVVFTQLDFLPLLMVGVIALALCPAIYGLTVVQGLIFPFTVVFGHGRYRLANGLLRLTKSARTEQAAITIYPIYRRGDWGFTVRIRLRRGGWRWPLYTGGIVGTKSEALQQSAKIQEWLLKTSIVREVNLGGWGNTDDIQPGEDYIK